MRNVHNFDNQESEVFLHVFNSSLPDYSEV